MYFIIDQNLIKDKYAWAVRCPRIDVNIFQRNFQYPFQYNFLEKNVIKQIFSTGIEIPKESVRKLKSEVLTMPSWKFCLIKQIICTGCAVIIPELHIAVTKDVLMEVWQQNMKYTAIDCLIN